MSSSVVSHVEVVGEGGELGSDGIDLLDTRSDAVVGTKSTDGEFVRTDSLGDLSIREPDLFGATQKGRRDLRGGVLSFQGEGEKRDERQSRRASPKFQNEKRGRNSLHSLLDSNNVFELAKEPQVDVTQFMNILDRSSRVKSVGDSEDSSIGRSFQLLVNVLHREGILMSRQKRYFSDCESRRKGLERAHLAETRERRINRTNSFLDRLFESFTDSHNFSYRLHGRTEGSRNTSELLEIPSGEFDDEVIKGRFETS